MKTLLIAHRGNILGPDEKNENEPSYIIHTVRFLSKLKNISYEKFSESTSQNFFNLFGKLN